MAENLTYTDLNLLLVSQLLNARTQNLSTVNRITLGTELTIANIGVHVWDTDLLQPFYWSGSAWINGGSSGTAWGSISGNLPDQNDLQTALNLKANNSISITASGSGILGGGNLTANRTFNLDFTFLDSRYAASGSGIVDANNGLSVVSNVAQLGGALLQQTDITGHFVLNLGTLSDPLLFLSHYVDQFFVSSDSVDITNSVNLHIRLNNTGAFLDADTVINGFLRINDGSQSSGRVFTSDGSGNGSWQDITLTDAEIIAGLGYIPADDTISILASGNGIQGGGDLTADRTINLDFTYLDARYAGSGSGVTSFNTRVGNVVLLFSDVTGALGFTPYNATNPANYITSAGAPVQSVFGRTGAVVLTSAEVSNGLSVSSGVAKWGGQLSGTTNIDLNTNLLTFKDNTQTLGGYFQLVFNSTGAGGDMNMNFSAVKGSQQSSFLANGSGISFSTQSGYGFITETSPEKIRIKLASSAVTGSFLQSSDAFGQLVWVKPTTIAGFGITDTISQPITGYVSGAGTVAATDTILQAIQKLNGNDALKAPLASPTFTGTVTLPAGTVINSPITGYVSGAGVVAATDSILQAIQKLNGNIAASVSGVSSVTNSDSTLTISPTTGAVVASLNLAHANNWTALQTYTFNAADNIIPSNAILLTNTTASSSASTNTYASPIIWHINSWKSTTPAAQTVDVSMFGFATKNTTFPNVGWAVQGSIAGGAAATLIAVTNVLGVVTVVTGGTDAIFSSPGTLKLSNNGGVHFLANGNRTSMGQTFVEVANKFSVAGTGTIFDPAAYIHIGAGAAAAGSAPLRFTAGTNLTTAITGVMEYNGTNYFLTPSSAVRNNILITKLVSSITPTAPNRTIEVVIDGTTYYIAAKTTND